MNLWAGIDSKQRITHKVTWNNAASKRMTKVSYMNIHIMETILFLKKTHYGLLVVMIRRLQG